jgi:hypothetical protein
LLLPKGEAFNLSSAHLVWLHGILAASFFALF